MLSVFYVLFNIFSGLFIIAFIFLIIFIIPVMIAWAKKFSAWRYLISLLPLYAVLVLRHFLFIPMCDCFEASYGIIVAIVLALFFMSILYGIAKYYEKKEEQPKKLIIFVTFISLVFYFIIFRMIMMIGDILFPQSFNNW